MRLLSDLVDIINDDVTLELTAELNQFNVFSILKIDNYEIRHANVLAWLLDPAANHGLGETFLRAFISRLQDNKDEANLAKQFELAIDRTVCVEREVRIIDLKKRNLSHVSPKDSENRDGSIDILLEGHDWILAIETKIRASESEGQLQKYRKALEEYAKSKYKDKSESKIELFYLFLTMDGDPPSSESEEMYWGTVNWREHVIAPLETTLSIHSQINPNVKHFLVNYVETLKKHTGLSKIEELADSISSQYPRPLMELKSLLQKSFSDKDGISEDVDRIYKRHHAVFEILFKRLTSTQRLRAEQLRRVVADYDFKAISENDTYITIVPVEWEKSFPVMLSGNDGTKITFEITNRFPDIKIKLMTPSLGKIYKDKLADARRMFVSMVHKSELNDIFNTAFYKVKDHGSKQPRPATDRYYSIFCKSKKIDSDTNPKVADEFIEATLKSIKTELLPKVEELMRESGIS